MDAIRVRGNGPLKGTIRVGGAKNAALPILCATLLSDGQSRLRNVPGLRDIRTTGELLGVLGRETKVDIPEVIVGPSTGAHVEAPYELVRQMRASILVLGPLVARHGRARVSLPGGCAIGSRPVDQHLKGLEALGAKIKVEHGFIEATTTGKLVGTEIVFDMPTVTGTENIMMACALAKGRSTLVNCAREPEVEELGRVLNKMGAKVDGAGTAVIHITGADELDPFDHAIISDRIEAGTFMAAVGAAGGNVLLEHAPLDELEPVIAKLRAAGLSIDREGESVRVVREGPVRAVDVTTAPHPGFPTDMQAQFMALMTIAEGRAVLTETIFENRFMHVPELQRMGARIRTHNSVAFVDGVKGLSGASVMATDLRASASLVIAGLVADSETIVRRVYHLDRGYESIEKKLGGVGANIERIQLEGP